MNAAKHYTAIHNVKSLVKAEELGRRHGKYLRGRNLKDLVSNETGDARKQEESMMKCMIEGTVTR